MRSRTPLIAIALLLLPPLYVGSYFALVLPTGMRCVREQKLCYMGVSFPNGDYRWGGPFAARVYSPLKQVDRKLRPRAWRMLEKQRSGMTYLTP